MDKYRRVEKPKSDLSDIKENEVRITTQGKMRNYISYATNLLSDSEKQASEIILKAMGRAINKTVTIAEIIKRRIPGLHQITQIDSTDITDVWEPLEEGLDKVVTTRHVSSIQIILSTKQLDTSHVGYQPPLPADQVKPAALGFDAEPRPRRGRGRGRGRGGFRGGRGGRGPVDGGVPSPAAPQGQFQAEAGQGEFEGRPRGRGGRRGGRGRGRGRGAGNFGGDFEQGAPALGGAPLGSPQQGGRGAFRGRGRGGRGRGGRGGRGGLGGIGGGQGGQGGAPQTA